jgi:thiamine transporter ThiT
MAAILAVLVAAVYIFVYVTGGINFVYSHSMYLPILLSGFVFGIRGGVLTGLVGGIVLGPFMPINVATGRNANDDQLAVPYRVLYSGRAFSGIASDSARNHIQHLNGFRGTITSTGLPNRRALLKSCRKLPGRNTVRLLDPCCYFH